MKGGHTEGARIYAELRGAAKAAEMQELAQGMGAEAVIAELSLDVEPQQVVPGQAEAADGRFGF
jgi:hypothetical protein